MLYTCDRANIGISTRVRTSLQERFSYAMWIYSTILHIVAFSWICFITYSMYSTVVDLACFLPSEFCASAKKKSDPARRSLVKRCQDAKKVSLPLISLIFFISASLSEVKCHLLRSGKVRKLSIYYVWWGAIWSPLSWKSTTRSQKKNWSSTFGVRGRVECVCYWCFNKVPVYVWLNFKLKREQEIAVESVLIIMNQDVVLPTAYEKS